MITLKESRMTIHESEIYDLSGTEIANQYEVISSGVLHQDRGGVVKKFMCLCLIKRETFDRQLVRHVSEDRMSLLTSHR